MTFIWYALRGIRGDSTYGQAVFLATMAMLSPALVMADEAVMNGPVQPGF